MLPVMLLSMVLSSAVYMVVAIAVSYTHLITLVVEEAILLVFITWLGFNSMLIKVIAQVIVIVLNYVISKLVVFKERS